MLSRKISGKRRKVNIGDMDRVITIQNRNLMPSSTNDEYFLEFTPTDTTEGTNRLANGEIYAAMESLHGVVMFDNTGGDVAITHAFYSYYLPITSEQWILYEGDRYDIFSIEPLDGRKEFMRINAIFKGPSTSYNNVI